MTTPALQTQPRPRRSRRYRDHFRRLPGWLRGNIDRHSRDLADFMREAAAAVPPGRLVVDVGAGEGPYRDLYAHARYLGVDSAQGDPEWNYSQVDVIGDLLSMPFDDSVADAAICTQVLEHVRDPERLLKEIHRILKPGASVFLTAPQGWAEHQQPHDYFRFTSFALRMLFERAGFDEVDIRPLGGYFTYLANRIAQMPKYLFEGRSRFARACLKPLELLLLPIVSGIVPLVFNSLDRFDRRRDFTLGYSVRARRAQGRT